MIPGNPASTGERVESQPIETAATPTSAGPQGETVSQETAAEAREAADKGNATAALRQLAETRVSGPRALKEFKPAELTAAQQGILSKITARINARDLTLDEVNALHAELLDKIATGLAPTEWDRATQGLFEIARKRTATTTPEAASQRMTNLLMAFVDFRTTPEQRARQAEAQRILTEVERLAHLIDNAISPPNLERQVVPQIIGAKIPQGLKTFIMQEVVPIARDNLNRAQAPDIPVGIWKWEKAEQYAGIK